MASKVHLMKFLQEVRGYDLVTNRRPPARLGGIYLSQLRAHLGDAHPPSKRKLTISVNPQDISNTPAPVRIVQAVPARVARAAAH